MFWSYQNPVSSRWSQFKRGMMYKNKKGGRPTKSLIEKKSYRVNLKMSTQEYYTLKGRAKEAQISVSEYLRRAIACSVVKQRLSSEVLGLVRQLCGMANNLNQIARKANTYGYQDARSEYLQLADRIDKLIHQMSHDS